MHCLSTNKMQSHTRFEQYGFSEEEMIYWLKRVRLYSDAESVEELLSASGFKLNNRMIDKNLGRILVYEK